MPSLCKERQDVLFLSVAKFILSAVTQCRKNYSVTLRCDLLSPWLTKLSPFYVSFWMLILTSWVYFGSEKWYLTFILICNDISSQYTIAPHGSYSLSALFSRWHFYTISLNQFYALLNEHITLAIINYPLSLYRWHINTIRIFNRSIQTDWKQA